MNIFLLNLFIDTIFCVDVDHYEPDLVLIDFSVNDMGSPKLMEALIRKTLSLKSKPIVLLVSLSLMNFSTSIALQFLIDFEIEIIVSLSITRN